MIAVVTGAAGSIGSSLVRVLADGGDYSAVRAVDMNESGLHALAVGCTNVRPIVADVRDESAMRHAVAGAGVVVHCAAMKHVSICEYNPDMSVATNVGGTGAVLRAADDAGVRRFVLLSTDKASQPTSVMAATKLLAERMLSGYAKWRAIETCAIRFGNVFFSRGSVVPVWLRSVARGEPIRVTDRSATRYSIEIDKAVMGIVRLMSRRIESGTTYAMSMRAYSLGLLADQFCATRKGDVKQEIVGLQAGEKMHELSLSPDEAARARVDGEFWAINPAWPASDVPDMVWDSEHAEMIQQDELREMILRYAK